MGTTTGSMSHIGLIEVSTHLYGDNNGSTRQAIGRTRVEAGSITYTRSLSHWHVESNAIVIQSHWHVE